MRDPPLGQVDGAPDPPAGKGNPALVPRVCLLGDF